MGANNTTPNAGKVINQPGLRVKSRCIETVVKDGAITVPTIMVRLLQSNKANIPVFDKLFIAEVLMINDAKVRKGGGRILYYSLMVMHYSETGDF
jgi:hypothetical protein